MVLLRDLVNYYRFGRHNWGRWKYWGGGMGIHPIQCELIQDLIESNSYLKIIEFGSGNSTQFFSDFSKDLVFELTSIDHNIAYAWGGKDKRINLLIRPLKRIPKDVFEQALSTGYNPEQGLGQIFNEKISFRTPYLFYDLCPKDLPQSADLVIIDGPNGNGRLLSVASLYRRLKLGSHVLIDDIHHYHFENILSNFFYYETICKYISSRVHPLFGFGFYKIIGFK